MNENIKNLEGEIWIENNGYKISNKGRFINKKGKLIKGTINQFGYVSIRMNFEDGFKVSSLHRIVAYAFLGKPPHKDDEVNHIDGNKLNNCVENLEWVTHKQNMQHRSDILGCMVGTDNPINKLTEIQVLEIYNLCKEGKLTYKEIADIYNVYKANISRISLGLSWKYLKNP